MTKVQKAVTAWPTYSRGQILGMSPVTALVCFHYLCLKLGLGKLYAPPVKGADHDNYCINNHIWKSQLDTHNWSRKSYCSLQCLGGSPLTGAKLQDCITRAITRHKEVKKLIDKVIKSITPKWTKRALFKNGFVKIVFVTVFTNLLY